MSYNKDGKLEMKTSIEKAKRKMQRELRTLATRKGETVARSDIWEMAVVNAAIAILNCRKQLLRDRVNRDKLRAKWRQQLFESGLEQAIRDGINVAEKEENTL